MIKIKVSLRAIIIVSSLGLLSCSSSVKEGYTDKVSYFNGETVHVYLGGETEKKNYSIEVTNLSGETMAEFDVDLAVQNPQANSYEKGYGFEETFSFQISDFPSGIYLIDDQIPFVVKPDVPKKVMVLYSSNTENAYCASGGKSTYAYNSSENIPAEIVSFHRPINLAFHSDEFLYWLADQTYDVGYLCDMDMDDLSNLEGAELLIIAGHSEYWTRQARHNFDHFIDNGGNALIISGNTMWWQVRYTEDKSQMIAYKNFKNDTLVPDTLRSQVWSYAKLDYPIGNSIGVDFEHGGFGLKEDDGWDGFKIVCEESPLLNGTELEYGDILSLPSDELDGAHLEFKGNKVELINDYGFYKYELIGYDLASRKENSNGVWIVMQKTPESGIIINAASTNWCDKSGINGDDGDLIEIITKNSIEILLNKKNVFSK